jgi:hypothetical protein
MAVISRRIFSWSLIFGLTHYFLAPNAGRRTLARGVPLKTSTQQGIVKLADSNIEYFSQGHGEAIARSCFNSSPFSGGAIWSFVPCRIRYLAFPGGAHQSFRGVFCIAVLCIPATCGARHGLMRESFPRLTSRRRPPVCRNGAWQSGGRCSFVPSSDWNLIGTCGTPARNRSSRKTVAKFRSDLIVSLAFGEIWRPSPPYS